MKPTLLNNMTLTTGPMLRCWFAIFTLSIFMAGVRAVHAQSKAVKHAVSSVKSFETSINLLASYHGDSVLLRWSTGTPGGWEEAKKNGFVVSRTTLGQDGAFDPTSFKRLTPQPLKPWPLEKWATLAGQNSTDDYAKIAAQCLYGKSLSAPGFIPRADEYSTRFSFTMLAADLSAAAAQALGIRFVDKTIEKGKVYIYKVETLADTSKYKLNPGVISVNTEKSDVIPTVYIDRVVENQNQIELRWNRTLHEQYFSAYFIERSDDGGKTFKRLNRMPYIHAAEEKSPVSADNIMYMDSIPLNYKSYQYRVIGLTPFGERAKPSPIVSGKGKDRTPPPVPQKVQAKHAGGSRVRITWDYPKNKEVKGFLIGRGNNPAKSFTPLVTDPLPAKTREFIDEHANETGSNYYIVAAVDTAGNASISLAQYAMIIDSLPPAPPTKLIGKIDTTGVVTVRWKLGPEQDIKGYLVFFANHNDHEFSQLTHNVLQDTVFRDTITLKTLTKKIYYRVVAVDYNSNTSGFSEMLELKRPDVVPPSGAVMDHYKIAETGVELHWVTSSSEDLAKTILYRVDDKSKAWKEIASFAATDKTQSFTDTTSLRPGKLYTYSLVCFDEDGLQSKRSIPIKLKFPDLKNYQAVNTIDAMIIPDESNILVTWNYPVKGDYRFIIYRAVNGSAFTSYKSINAPVSTFKDKEIKKGSSYEYSVGVIFKNGKKAPYGKIVKTVF